MKHIYTTLKFIQTPLMIATLLLGMSGNAWGVSRTWKGGVAVGSGKGEAKVEVFWKVALEGTDKEATSSSSTVAYATASQSALFSTSLIKHGCKYSVVSETTGYSFAGWYSSSNCSGNAANTSSTWTAKSATTDSWSCTYYAKFAPHTYTIKFNNNGGSGSMGDLAMTYDVAKNLTSNSFTRTGYTFSGWNTKADGTGTSYSNSASVKNLTSTDGATITLYAQWTANTYTVKFNGNGNSGGSTADQSFTYDKAQNLRANGFTRAYTVTFDANGGSCATSSATATYTFAGWAKSATGAKEYDNQQSVSNLTSTNNGTVNLYAVWNGSDVTLPVATKEGKVLEGWFAGEEYIGAKNALYAPTQNITLTAHWQDIAAPRYSWNGEESYLVGDAALNLDELWVSANDEAAKTFSLVSFVPSGTNNEGAVTPSLTGSMLTLGQAGEVTVKVSQPATEYFYAGEETLTITINKHENTILVKGKQNYHSEIEVDSYDNGFTFAATNTDYVACPITVEQLTGQSIATYYPNEKVVYSGSTCGEASWQVSQPENYYYMQATTTFAIDVRLMAEVACYVVDDASEHSFTTGMLDFTGHFDDPIAVSVPVKTLSFSAKKDLLGANYFVAQYSIDNGNTWKDIVSPDLSNSYQNFGPYNLPVHNITHIRFGAKTGGTLSKYYKNIKLTRYTYLNLSEESMTFDKTAANQAIYPGETSAAKTFTIDWSMPNNGTEIQITSTNPDFHVSPSVISNTACNNGQTVITVTYSSECAETETGKIRIGNQVFFKEIAVSGTTIKRDQTISWTQEQNLLTTDELVLDASATSGLDVAYSVVSGSDVATVNEQTGVVTILKSGDVTFRASQAGDCRYNAAEAVDRTFHIDLTPATLVFDNGNVAVSELASTIELDLTTLISSRSDEGAITYEVISSNAADATISSDKFSAVVIGDYTVRASKEETNYYTATTAEFVVTVVEGVIFIGSTDASWGEAANWSGGEVPTEFDRVIIEANVTISSDVEVTGLTVNAGKTLTIADGGQLTIGAGNSLSRETYGNVVVEIGGKLNLNAGELDANDFTLYSGFDNNHQPKSGQVSGQEMLSAHGHAYFILDLDPAGTATEGWYTFTVPFPVDELRGVERLDNGNWTAIVNEKDYAVMAYDEVRRAQTGKGWKKYTGILQPGVGYTLGVDPGSNSYRFTKTATGAFNTSMAYELQASSEGESVDIGWNSLGNGTMSYVTLNEEPLVQIYDHESNTYTGFNSAAITFAVGAAYFVQTASDGDELNMTAELNGTIRRAPQRDQTNNNRFGVSLATADKLCDNLFVTCEDEASATYTIGKDVQKMGNVTGTKVARMWTNAKGTKLCAVNAAYVNGQAIIPLQLFSPTKAEYTLSLDSNPDEDVYLMRNGNIVWNLTSSDYTFELNEGTDDTYALQVIRRVNNTATGVDAIGSDNHGTDFVEKMIVNGQLFILRDGALYDALGKKVTSL